jgi:regulator of RNase E activity RraA
MDLLGLAAGTIPATVLRPLLPGARLVGPALTVRNLPARNGVAGMVAAGRSGLGEIEAHNLTEPGDVLVIEGVPGCSSLGGMAAEIGHREGQAGAIVDGGVRDIGNARALGYPVFAREVVPLTGKWRVETVEINGPVRIAGVRVDPGDLICGDDSGVVVVPMEQAAAVLEVIRSRIAPYEAKRSAAIRAGASIAELAGAARR